MAGLIERCQVVAAKCCQLAAKIFLVPEDLLLTDPCIDNTELPTRYKFVECIDNDKQ